MNLTDPLLNLKVSFTLTRRDILWTLLPLLLWTAVVQLRPAIITLHCPSSGPQCIASTLPAIDQVALGMESPQADAYSFFTQNNSGVLAFSVPLLFQATRVALGATSPIAAASALGTDFVLILQAIGWNGFVGEATRVLTHRARPFVYLHQKELGDNPAHYTSFYSGHTSFAAVALTSLLLVLVSRAAPTWLVLFMGILAQASILSTAVFRVMAGRHFLTDVLAGAIAGSLVAFFVFARHKKNH